MSRNKKSHNPKWHQETTRQNAASCTICPEDDPVQILSNAKAAVAAGHIDQAVEILVNGEPAIQKMVDKDPSRTDVMFAVAAVLHITEQWSKAEKWYKSILKQKADATVHNKLGQICEHTGRLSEATQHFRNAMELEPDRAEFWASLATNLVTTGKLLQGLDLFRKAADKDPDNPQIRSNMLFNLHYLPDLDKRQLFEEHKQWARIHAPVSQAKTTHHNGPDPDRRLRVGYISPDFRGHSVAYFFESLLDGHDRRAVEVCGYANVASPDEVTERLKNKFDQYRNIAGTEAKEVSELIEQDRIDILVDLAGHTSNNSLAVLAYKPAPVQVTYSGYPDTTGMEQIDYRFTDALADSPQSQEFYTEKLISLPECFLCYRPPEFAPPVGPLPAEKNGYITFGSFNNNRKINSTIIALWAQILKANDDSRFILKLNGGDDHQTREYYFTLFEPLGISRERIEIYGRKTPIEHLQLYNQVDIALDTYPYNGTTTTCEALWMGVPVISLVGEQHFSRVGLSILSRVGMGFFAAITPQEYVAKAGALVLKTDALARIRTTMRARIAASGLCYAKAFARNVEAAYRKMWRQWCRRRQADVGDEELINCTV